MRKHYKPVLGVEAPGPKPTAKAIWLAIRYLGLPLIAALFAFDVAVWLVVEFVWGLCVGLWCWF